MSKGVLAIKSGAHVLLDIIEQDIGTLLNTLQ